MYLVDCACSCTNVVSVLIVPSIRRWRIDFKIGELEFGELTNMREVPVKTIKSCKIRIVAGRRFYIHTYIDNLYLTWEKLLAIAILQVFHKLILRKK